jgi:hypothetical protein
MKKLEQIVQDNLRNWLGNSRVLDSSGNPIELYHGSRAPWLTSFDLSFDGTGVCSHGMPKFGGIWFTSSRSTADYYTDRMKKSAADHNNCFLKEANGGGHHIFVCNREGHIIFVSDAYASEDEAMTVMPYHVESYNKKLRQNTYITSVYLRLENPLEVDVIPRKNEFGHARRAGCDGIIARGVVDGSGLSDVYVAFSPKQIKAARDNSGLYSPNDADIRDTKWLPIREQIFRAQLAAAKINERERARLTSYQP